VVVPNSLEYLRNGEAEPMFKPMIKRAKNMINILYLAIVLTLSAWFLKPPKH